MSHTDIFTRWFLYVGAAGAGESVEWKPRYSRCSLRHLRQLRQSGLNVVDCRKRLECHGYAWQNSLFEEEKRNQFGFLAL